MVGARGKGSRSGSNAEAAVVRVATYNLLHPPLCSGKRFPHCRPEDLGEAVRWKGIKAKLEEVMACDWPAVICLQEVGEGWAAQLHTFFQQRGWHFAFALTPLVQWPPMGVALAWPNAALALEDLRVQRPGAEFRAPQVPKPSGFKQLLLKLTRGRFGGPPPEFEPWTIAACKQNRLLAALLRDVRTGHRFVVATYHMPCLFGNAPLRQAKAIHAAILRDSLMRFANGLDLVLAGDLNTTPHDSELQVVKSGAMGMKDAARPPPAGDLELGTWLRGGGTSGGAAGGLLRSAYAEVLGEEPLFTNNAWIDGEVKPFRETIDYVFVSEHVGVDGVRALPVVDLEDSVYPSAQEPSDHVLLAADLRLGGGP